MPRVALTDEQRMQYAVKDACNAILDELHTLRGRKRMTHKDLEEKMEISHQTWWRWNKGDLAKAELGLVLMSVMRAGLDIKIVVSQK